MKLGGIVVNVNPLYAEEEVHRLLVDSGAEYAITLDLKLLLPKIVSALGRCALKKVVVGTMGEILRFPQRQLFAIAKRGDLARVPAGEDRKSVVEGKSVSVRVDRSGRRSLKKKKKFEHTTADSTTSIKTTNNK